MSAPTGPRPDVVTRLVRMAQDGPPGTRPRDRDLAARRLAARALAELTRLQRELAAERQVHEGQGRELGRLRTAVELLGEHLPGFVRDAIRVARHGR